tara:strand:- start:105 stop:350 length:246 start_codon:yes stop_codon:yes gene_type:complete
MSYQSQSSSIKSQNQNLKNYYNNLDKNEELPNVTSEKLLKMCDIHPLYNLYSVKDKCKECTKKNLLQCECNAWDNYKYRYE